MTRGEWATRPAFWAVGEPQGTRASPAQNARTLEARTGGWGESAVPPQVNSRFSGRTCFFSIATLSPHFNPSAEVRSSDR